MTNKTLLSLDLTIQSLFALHECSKINMSIIIFKYTKNAFNSKVKLTYKLVLWAY